MASVPLQAPLAVQLVALVEDQLRVELLPSTRLEGLAAMVTVGSAAAAVTVSVTSCEMIWLVLLVQVKV